MNTNFLQTHARCLNWLVHATVQSSSTTTIDEPTLVTSSTTVDARATKIASTTSASASRNAGYEDRHRSNKRNHLCQPEHHPRRRTVAKPVWSPSKLDHVPEKLPLITTIRMKTSARRLSTEDAKEMPIDTKLWSSVKDFAESSVIKVRVEFFKLNSVKYKG